MQLDVLVAAFERARGVALEVLGVAVILQQRGIAFDMRALGAAEQRRYRNALALAADVPERDVQARERVEHRPGAAHRQQHALEPRNKRAVGGALPDRETPDPVVERRDHHGAGGAERLAPADEAGSGRDAHIEAFDMGARHALRHRRRRPDVQRNAQRDRIDRGNLSSMLPVCWLIFHDLGSFATILRSK